VNTLVVVRRDHDDIGAAERRLKNASATGRCELNIAGKQGIDAQRRAPPIENRLASARAFWQNRASATQIALLAG